MNQTNPGRSMNCTERMVLSDQEKKGINYNEHLLRYELAKTFAAGKKVLDIACGSGYGTKMLAEAGAQIVTGVDVSQEAINTAQEKYAHEKINYILSLGDKLPFEDKSFDLIISFETIEHIDKDADFLKELKRVLKDDGAMIMSTPNREASVLNNPFHIREYSKKEFEDLLKKDFGNIRIFDQERGMASYLRFSDSPEAKILMNESSLARFFVAFCGNISLPDKNWISVNGAALKNLENNPALKISNKLYPYISKIPFFKNIVKYLKNMK